MDKIVVTETGNQTSNQQQLQTNTAAASMEFDAFPPVGAMPGLISQMKSGLNHNFNLGPTYSTNPYVVFNEVSPNNNKALSKVAVRQALSYGINRSHLITDSGGPSQGPPLTHILPPGINGAQDVPAGYDPYPYNPTKAKQMLAAAGYPNGLNLTLLYRPSSSIETKMAQTLQSDLSKIGVKVKLLASPSADFYVKYLERADRRQARRLGYRAVRLGPGLVRRCRPVVLQPAVLRPAVLPAGRAATSGSTTTPR